MEAFYGGNRSTVETLVEHAGTSRTRLETRADLMEQRLVGEKKPWAVFSSTAGADTLVGIDDDDGAAATAAEAAAAATVDD